MTQDNTRFSCTIREFEYEKAGLEKPLANEQQLYAIVSATTSKSVLSSLLRQLDDRFFRRREESS